MKSVYILYIRFMIWLGAAPPEGYEYLLPNIVDKAKRGSSSRFDTSFKKNRSFSLVDSKYFGVIIEIVFGLLFGLGIFVILSDWLIWGTVGVITILLTLVYTVYKDWQQTRSLGIGGATERAFVAMLIGVLVGVYFGISGGLTVLAAGVYFGAVIGAVVAAFIEFFIGFR
jgi:hypothetical protein